MPFTQLTPSDCERWQMDTRLFNPTALLVVLGKQAYQRGFVHNWVCQVYSCLIFTGSNTYKNDVSGYIGPHKPVGHKMHVVNESIKGHSAPPFRANCLRARFALASSDSRAV